MTDLRDLVLVDCSFHAPFPAFSFRLHRLFIANHSFIVLRHQICALEPALSPRLRHLALYFDHEVVMPWVTNPRKRKQARPSPLSNSASSASSSEIAHSSQLLARIRRVLEPVMPNLTSFSFDETFLPLAIPLETALEQSGDGLYVMQSARRHEVTSMKR